MRRATVTLAAAASLVAGFLGLSAPALAAGKAPEPPAMSWAHDGIFGQFDQAQLRRGLQVYSNVCAACHSLQLVRYRNLGALGLDEEQIKAFAAQYSVQDGPDDEGEMFTRPALPSDRFVSPFPNEQAARFANGGAYPPDLSLMVKARLGGADYLHGLLVGYEEPPAGEELMAGMYWNRYFPGHQIAMAPPLSDGSVDYDGDGPAATVDQMALDVTAFLAWTAEPELVDRKRLGIKVMLFMLLFTGILYAAKRKIWREVH